MNSFVDLSHVDEVAEQVENRIGEGASLVWVVAQRGSGRSTLLKKLGECAPERFVPIRLLSLFETDAAIHGLYQAAASLEQESERRELVRDWPRLRQGALRVAETMRRAGKIPLLRIPDSWRLDETPRTDGAQTRLDRARALVHAWTSAAEQSPSQGDPFQMVLVTRRDMAPQELGFEGRGTDAALPTPEVVASALFDEERWGSYGEYAAGLGRGLDQLPFKHPVLLRLYVGCVALGIPLEKVIASTKGKTVFLSLSSSVELISKQFERQANQELGDAVRRLLACRDRLSRQAIVEICRPPTEHVPFLTECVAYGGDEVGVNDTVRDLFGRHLEPLNDDAEVHTAYAEHYAKLDGVPALWSARGISATAWMERAHHIAHGDDQSWGKLEMPCRELLWERGRYLSRVRQDYEGAAKVYQQCVNRFEDDDYGWHYLAFNLDRAGLDRRKAEDGYAKAVELNEKNPWWNSRLVSFLIHQGRPRTAEKSWLLARERVDPDGERVQSDVWLARHFYYWVAEAWLETGRPEMAIEVLDGVPDETLGDRTSKMPELVHRIADALEVETLGDRVHPAELPMELRWTLSSSLEGQRSPGGAAIESWFPARVIGGDEDGVDIIYAVPSEQESERQLLATRILAAEWPEEALGPPQRAEGFLVLLIFEDGYRLVVERPTDADSVVTTRDPENSLGAALFSRRS